MGFEIDCLGERLLDSRLDYLLHQLYPRGEVPGRLLDNLSVLDHDLAALVPEKLLHLAVVLRGFSSVYSFGQRLHQEPELVVHAHQILVFERR